MVCVDSNDHTLVQKKDGGEVLYGGVEEWTAAKFGSRQQECSVVDVEVTIVKWTPICLLTVITEDDSARKLSQQPTQPNFLLQDCRTFLPSTTSIRTRRTSQRQDA